MKQEVERVSGPGTVARARIAVEKDTNRKRGFGYVDIWKKEVAEVAASLELLDISRELQESLRCFGHGELVRAPKKEVSLEPVEIIRETLARRVPACFEVHMSSSPVSGAFDFSNLSNMSFVAQKNAIGEALYPLIHQQQPVLAGKITGMLLELDNAELLLLLESPDSLSGKIEEAMQVLLF